MKKRGIFVLLSIIIIILSLFSISCTKKGIMPGEEEEIDVYRGTQGLEMEFVRNLPRSKIYDTDTLDIVVELKNKGTSDLKGNKCYLTLSGFDRNILPELYGLYSTPMQCGDLEKKSIYNPEGGFDTKEYIATAIYLPEGVDSLPQNIILHACYEYQTKASPIICINPRLYDLRAAEEACVVQDVSLAGGQGAPVAVTRVDVDMMKNKALFKIYITNIGKGTVLSSTTSFRTECPFFIDYNNMNIIDNFQVSLSGAGYVDCKPDKIRLINNRGTITCTAPLYQIESAYTTPLRITLNYRYLDSISKQIEIIKTPG